MWAVFIWIGAVLNWLLPVRSPASSRPQVSPVRMSAWQHRHGLTMHRLAPIHPPSHRRRL